LANTQTSSYFQSLSGWEIGSEFDDKKQTVLAEFLVLVEMSAA